MTDRTRSESGRRNKPAAPPKVEEPQRDPDAVYYSEGLDNVFKLSVESVLQAAAMVWFVNLNLLGPLGSGDIGNIVLQQLGMHISGAVGRGMAMYAFEKLTKSASREWQELGTGLVTSLVASYAIHNPHMLDALSPKPTAETSTPVSPSATPFPTETMTPGAVPTEVITQTPSGPLIDLDYWKDWFLEPDHFNVVTALVVGLGVTGLYAKVEGGKKARNALQTSKDFISGIGKNITRPFELQLVRAEIRNILAEREYESEIAGNFPKADLERERRLQRLQRKLRQLDSSR